MCGLVVEYVGVICVTGGQFPAGAMPSARKCASKHEIERGGERERESERVVCEARR